MSQADVANGSAAGVAERWALLGTATFVTMLYAITVTIASVALPDMRGAMSATQDQITWTITGNIVATAVTTPLAGWLAGRINARRLLLWSVAGFIVVTVLCGTATSLQQLVGFRVLQGVFGAPLVPVAQALVLTAFPERQRGMAMAIWGMGVVLGPIIAPTLGGYLSEHLGWRWIFFMLVPFGFAALAGVWAFVPKREPTAFRRLDWLGFLSLSAGVAALQIMLDRGERNGWFDSPETIAEACIAVAGFYIFFTHSLTSKHPFLNLKILADRNFSVGLLLVFCFGLLNFVPMILFPPLLQELRGYPQSIVGLLLGTRGLGTFVGFAIMAFGERFDPRIPLAFGFGLQAYAGWVMSDFDINLTTWSVAWSSALQGLGVGLAWVPISVIAFSTLKPQQLPEATAIFQLLRNMASSLFISISVAVVLHTGKISYAEEVVHLSPLNPLIDYRGLMGGWDLSSAKGLAAMSQEVQRQSLMIGYLNAFRLFTWTALAALPLVLLVRYKRPGR